MHTPLNVAKASVSLLSGDIVGGGVSLASMAISQASSSMDSAIPISGVSAEYLSMNVIEKTGTVMYGCYPHI